MAWRPPIMKHRPTARRRRSSTRSVLRLLDLEHSKTAVLNSLTSQDAQRGYRHAIDDFVDWYCSEPRLAFNRIVVLRYRSYLESRSTGSRNGQPPPGRCAAARVRSQGLKGKRDRALRALLLTCGLRRDEAVGLRIDDLQQREEHRAIVDLVGKAGHVRTVQIPDWVKGQLDEWLRAAGIGRGRIFRRVTRMGRPWGDCMTEKSIWHIVKDCAKGIGMPKLAPHDLRRTCARLCHAAGGELEQIQFLLGHVSVQTTERYLGCKQRIRSAVNDRIGIEPNS